MVRLVTDENWAAIRASLDRTTDDFGELVRSVDADAMATADWSVATMAAHVVAVSGTCLSILRPDDAALAPSLAEQIPGTTVDTVADLNLEALRHIEERDPHLLAKRLRAEVDQILRSSADVDPAKSHEWLGSSHLPTAGLLAHLLNEIVVHGWDIARATGAEWKRPTTDAAPFFQTFLFALAVYGYGHLLDLPGPERKGRISVEFRSRHTTPVTLVLDDGEITLREPRRGADVKIFFDPLTLDHMLFGRVSTARAALTGKVVVWGRRPWLLPAFMRKMRLPS